MITEAWDDPKRIARLQRDIVEHINDIVIKLPLPDDQDKEPHHWDELEKRSKWRQDAFNKYFTLADRYLEESRGVKRTSNDIHMMCQGIALAMSTLPYFLSAEFKMKGE